MCSVFVIEYGIDYAEFSAPKFHQVLFMCPFIIKVFRGIIVRNV